MPYTKEDLDQANQHVADVEKLIETQRARIEELRHEGHSTDKANELLIILLETRHQVLRHRELIARELDIPR